MDGQLLPDDTGTEVPLGARLGMVASVRDDQGRPLTARVFDLSTRSMLVEDVDVPVGAPCRVELCSPSLRLTARCRVANRIGGFAGLVVVGWDGLGAGRAVRQLVLAHQRANDRGSRFHPAISA